MLGHAWTEKRNRSLSFPLFDAKGPALPSKNPGEIFHWRPASQGYAAGRPAAVHEESGKVWKKFIVYEWIVYDHS